MGSRLRGLGHHVKHRTPNSFRYSPVPAPSNLLPIYGSGRELLGYVSPAAAQRMLDLGHVLPYGTKHRIRGLVAVHDNLDLLPPGPLPAGTRYSHKRETRDNPQGVWTFRKLTHTMQGF